MVDALSRGASDDRVDVEWPDKAMFAGILLLVGGLLGSAFSIALMVDDGFLDEDIRDVLSGFPAWISLVFSLGMAISGVFGVRHHTKTSIYPGVVCGVLSIAFFGLVPLFALIALGFMIKAHLEGEDTRRDTVAPDPDDWPDKALAASLFLMVAGIVTLFQATMVLAGTFAPVLEIGGAKGFALFQIVAAAVSLLAAKQVYGLRSSWLGYLGVASAAFGLAFIVLGPLLGAIALYLLWRAERENEFF